jgi:hypothetical protein
MILSTEQSIPCRARKNIIKGIMFMFPVREAMWLSWWWR